MEFDWHDEKSDACLEQRGFDFDYARHVFDDEIVEFVDDRHDYGEVRMVAFGRIDGALYCVVYTQRDEVRWIISAFRCKQRELDRWKLRVGAGR